MANPFRLNFLGGFDVGQGIQDVSQAYQQGQQQEQLSQQRAQMKQLMQGAASGDPDAIEGLIAVNPELGMKFEQRELDRRQKLGDEVAEQAKQAETDWGIRWLQASPEERAALQQEALQNPLIDIDESDLSVGEEQSNLAINSMLYKNLGKDAYQDLIQKGIDPAKKKELELKQEANDLRRMEVEQRALDRKLKKETNKLKREKLRNDLEKSKQEMEQKKREMASEAKTAISSFDNSLSTIERIRNSPGFSAAVGARVPFVDAIPGSDAQETIGLIETLQSQTFLNEVKKMKGMGALSENEGKKLSAAIGSLNRDMSEKAFRRSLDEIEKYLKKGKQAVKERFGMKEEKAEQGLGRFKIIEVEE